jgi:hypothetical protein
MLLPLRYLLPLQIVRDTDDKYIHLLVAVCVAYFHMPGI